MITEAQTLPSFDQVIFPDPRLADKNGLVAIGGDFGAQTLLAAYAHGIFPWPSDGLTFAWFSPDPRMILRPTDVHISHSLKKTLRRGHFETTFDRAFDRVIEACASARYGERTTTWIVKDLRRGFLELHRLGVAHSVETWLEGRLVGGLYGLSIGAMFCGESMFHFEPDASKVAFVALARRLESWGFPLLDCQVESEHLTRLGAVPISRTAYLDELARLVNRPTRLGSWSLP